MKKTLLASVAAIGLIGGATVAFSQGNAGGGAAGGVGSGSGATSAPMNSPTSAPSTGSAPSSTMDRASPSGPAATAPADEGQNRQGAQDRTKTQNQKSTQGQNGTQQRQAEQPSKSGTSTKQGENDRPAAGTRQGENDRAPAGSKSGTAERSMNSKSVSLTTEQKTTIRKTVLTSSAPRISGRVNFDIRVGTVVPRTVRVVALPRTIIEIEPEWRGYRYFVSGDQIIVVEPRTLEIVAILDV